MINLSPFAVLCIAGLLVAVPVECQEVSNPEHQGQITSSYEFDRAAAKALIYAINDFEGIREATDCFRIFHVERNNLIEIAFLPASEDNLNIIPNPPLVDRTDCGSGLVYQFDENGNFLRNVYFR